MPQIKPFDLSPELPSEINDILASATGQPIETTNTKSNDLNAARQALNSHGASIDDIARTIAGVMKNSETENGKLRASEMALKVHGILQEMETKQIPNVTINVIGFENKTLINLVLPT